MSKYTVWYRRPLVVLTDPQRRVYNGCMAKSEHVMSSWSEICTYTGKENAEDSATMFKRINPTSEYAVLPLDQHPEN